MLFFVAGLVQAGVAEENQFDPGFDGQILTMTQPKADVGPSKNPRYQLKGEGTVLDLELNLVWSKDDTYQQEKDWINWHDAQKYIEKLNKKKFGDASNWRLPDRKELAGLFDENSSIPWNYYWTKNEVHMDPVFGSSHCCYWSSEEYREEMAWGFNFIRGRKYISMQGGIQKSLSVVRAVRDLTPEEKAEAETLRQKLGIKLTRQQQTR